MSLAERIGPITDDVEMAAFADLVRQCFNGLGGDLERVCKWLDWIGPANLRVLWQRGRIVAGLGILRFGHVFGGKSVSTGGISIVSVAPEARGRGLGNRLMEATVVEMADEGLALSSLYPATYHLYRKSGYEPAGARIVQKLPLQMIGVKDYARVIRPARFEEWRELDAVHRVRAQRGAGLCQRGEQQWKRIFSDWEGPVYAYRVDVPDGACTGYVIFSEEGPPRHAFDLYVRDMAALDPPAARRILTLFSDHASVSENVRYLGGLADPIVNLARELHVEIAQRDLWMLRVLDATGALRQRGYPAGVRGSVSLEIADALLARNAGRFVLEVADQQAALAPGGEGRVRIDIRGLASLYTGHQSPGELLTAELISGPAEDLALLASMFAGPAPWMNDRF